MKNVNYTTISFTCDNLLLFFPSFFFFLIIIAWASSFHLLQFYPVCIPLNDATLFSGKKILTLKLYEWWGKKKFCDFFFTSNFSLNGIPSPSLSFFFSFFHSSSLFLLSLIFYPFLPDSFFILHVSSLKSHFELPSEMWNGTNFLTHLILSI